MFSVPTTLKRAGALVTDPNELLSTTLKLTLLSAGYVVVKEKGLVVAPEIVPPFLSQRKVMGVAPSPITVNLAMAPAETVAGAGSSITYGENARAEKEVLPTV